MPSSRLNERSNKYGLFTHRQLLVLGLRTKGYSLRDIAKIVGVSHQDVALIEKRALENIEKARKTLLIYEVLTSPVKIILREGTRHVDIPQLIISEADKAGITIKADIGLLLRIIWRRAEKCIENRVVKEPILVMIDRQGELHVYPLKELRELFDIISSIEEEISKKLYK